MQEKTGTKLIQRGAKTCKGTRTADAEPKGSRLQTPPTLAPRPPPPANNNQKNNCMLLSRTWACYNFIHVFFSIKRYLVVFLMNKLVTRKERLLASSNRMRGAKLYETSIQVISCLKIRERAGEKSLPARKAVTWRLSLRVKISISAIKR